MNSSITAYLKRLKISLQGSFTLKFGLRVAGFFSPAPLPSGERNLLKRGVASDFINVRAYGCLCRFLLGFVLVFFSSFAFSQTIRNWPAGSVYRDHFTGARVQTCIDRGGASYVSSWPPPVYMDGGSCLGDDPVYGCIVSLSCNQFGPGYCPEGQSPVFDGTCEDDEPPQECDEEPGSPAGSLVTSTEERGTVYCKGICEITAASGYRDGESFVTFFAYTGNTCSSGDGGGGDGGGSGGGDGGGDPPAPDDPPEYPGFPEPADPDNPPDEPPVDPPAPSPSSPKDTDGDGTPDGSDPDIDGDGTPNGSDTDTDGDGVPNTDDINPNGENEEEEPSEASTSDDCFYAPSCSGDAIQCGQLLEIWRLRCKEDESTDKSVSGALDCSSPFVCDGDALACASLEISRDRACALGVDTVVSDINSHFTAMGYSKVDETVEVDKTIDIASSAGDFLNPGVNTGSCISAPSFVFNGNTIDIPVDGFCDLGLLMRPFVILGATLMGALMFFRTLREL